MIVILMLEIITQEDQLSILNTIIMKSMKFQKTKTVLQLLETHQEKIINQEK